MDENTVRQEATENAEPVPENKTKPRPAWLSYLETEEATRMVYLVFGFIAIAMTMTFLQTRTSAICCGDWDGYYHIRWSSLLWENLSSGKWLPDFTWLPLTVLNPESYNDHHFLFHLLQIPFLWFFEPVTAAKVATVVFGTIAIFSVYWLLHRYKIDHQLIWLGAILTCANMFFYRMNMAKAPPLTIIFSIAGIYMLFERRYVWLLPLMFAFVWTYSLFPLLFVAAIIWAGIIGWNERKFEWEPIAYSGAGMIAGNLINPYFPNNLVLFWEHLKTKLFVGGKFAVSVGGEWYPYEGTQLLTHFAVALIAMFIGYVLFMPRNGKLPEKATFFLVFVTMLLIAQFTSKRYAEYFPPFAILFAAFSWQAFKKTSATQLPEEFRREIEPFLDADKRSASAKNWDTAKTIGLWLVGLALFVYFLVGMAGLQRFGIDHGGLMGTIKGNEANDKYRRMMEWATGLNEHGQPNIPEGERIFNANWDDFPKLFFYDQKHSYVYGLDPNYLYSEDPDLYKLLLEITEGKKDDAGPLIRENFGASYVFVDAKENEQMVAKLLDSGWADIIHEDDEARMLKIREQKGEPPSLEDQAAETEEEKRILDEEERRMNSNGNADDLLPPEDGEGQ